MASKADAVILAVGFDAARAIGGRWDRILSVTAGTGRADRRICAINPHCSSDHHVGGLRLDMRGGWIARRRYCSRGTWVRRGGTGLAKGVFGAVNPSGTSSGDVMRSLGGQSRRTIATT